MAAVRGPELQDRSQAEVEDVELQEYRGPAEHLDVSDHEPPGDSPRPHPRRGQQHAERHGDRERRHREQGGHPRALDEQRQLAAAERRGCVFGPVGLGCGRGREPLLRVVPEMPRLEDSPQLSGRDQLRDGAVDGCGERRVVPAHSDHVAALHRRADALDPGEGTAVALGDDVIEQHGVDAPLPKIEVRLLLPLVEHRLEGPCLEELERYRLVQGADALAAEVVERRVRRPPPDREDLVIDEVRAREPQPRAPLGGVFQAVERDVDVPSFERRNEIRPLHLEEARPSEPELARDRRGDVDLETNDLRRVLRVLEDVRLTALQVAAPDELAPLADGRQTIRARGEGDRDGRARDAEGGQHPSHGADLSTDRAPRSEQPTARRRSLAAQRGGRPAPASSSETRARPARSDSRIG